jgi:hypothetical protein
MEGTTKTNQHVPKTAEPMEETNTMRQPMGLRKLANRSIEHPAT